MPPRQILVFDCVPGLFCIFLKVPVIVLSRTLNDHLSNFGGSTPLWCLPGKSWFLIGSGLVKSIVGREAINELSSKADRPISLMESLITDRQAQVTDQGLCLTYYSKCVSLIIQN